MSITGYVAWAAAFIICLGVLIMFVEQLGALGRKAVADGVIIAVDGAVGVPIGTEALRHCARCNSVVFHRTTVREVSSSHGPQVLTVWTCETHPLPRYGLVLAGDRPGRY